MRENTQKDYTERILRVLVFIQKNLDEPLDLVELAQIANFSPYHFHRIFRGMIGESVKAHVRRLRLERAAAQLYKTNDSIIAVALRSGFDSHAAFSRAFKSMTQFSPSDWRRNYLQNLPPVETGIRYSSTQPLTSFVPLTSEGKTMEVKIVNKEAQKVAFVRHVGPYEECGPAWGTLCGILGPLGCLKPGLQFVGLCHDDPEITPAEKIRYDACIPVDDGFEASGPVGVQEIPAGKYAVTVHRGPFDGLKNTYATLHGQWLPASGQKAMDFPSQEVYLNDPETTAPEDLLVEIFVALEG
ncbi:MAG: AraC family transcriptional regulator [bacterium]|nr:AraC family transcriptional regulator [bacterium]